MVTAESLSSGADAIAVVGLGYVGLPLAVQLSKHFRVVGYDLKEARVRELRQGYDRTLEVEDEELRSAQLSYTSDPADMAPCRLIIVAVPTPLDQSQRPDLGPLQRASTAVGRVMGRGTCVVFESTVYPGATEEECVPILAAESGLAFGVDFTVGYSPERINPGDKVHTIDKITKIISGSDAPTLQLLDQVYSKIVKAGLHHATTVRVAEAAKVIENTQRDLNIALMNELAMIFDKLGIDTLEVLEAAGTKWNFLPFRPGLVGGHCIGVDPYYLTSKAAAVGYRPEIILAGRRINDNMGKFIAERTVKLMIRRGMRVRGARVALLGLTFKENVPDLRNTRVVDIVAELEDYGVEVVVHDPLADPHEAQRYYGIELQDLESISETDGVIVAVLHHCYKEMGLERIAALCKADSRLVIDLKSAFTVGQAEELGIAYWRL